MMQHSVTTQFDPFVAPATTPIAAVRVRDLVGISGSVTNLTVEHWAGGTPALHVTITDETGSLTVAFLGRTRVAGIEVGKRILVGGAVFYRRGRRIMMNPHLWLLSDEQGVVPAAAERQLLQA